MLASSSGPLTIESSLEGGRRMIRLAGELDRRAAPDLLAFLEAPGGRGQKIVLDLGRVTSIDAAGVGAVLDAHGNLAATGGELTVTAAGPDVQRVLQRVLAITGLQRIGPFERDAVDARPAAGRPADRPPSRDALSPVD